MHWSHQSHRLNSILFLIKSITVSYEITWLFIIKTDHSEFPLLAFRAFIIDLEETEPFWLILEYSTRENIAFSFMFVTESYFINRHRNTISKFLSKNSNGCFNSLVGVFFSWTHSNNDVQAYLGHSKGFATHSKWESIFPHPFHKKSCEHMDRSSGARTFVCSILLLNHIKDLNFTFSTD